ncbi:MAG: hypothetical protein DCC49_04430 [Acidobacteria bacterium]|nr:MAG: hypothetical protein DCC49_04430 [Acidobacteriota bacterium]
MRPTAIIQARMGSERLPGKVLMQLGEKQVLEHLVDRVSRAEGVGRILIATTDLEPDNAIAAFATARGVGLFRGDSSDVLLRYVEAASADSSPAVLRITGDCPLIDPAVISAVVGAWWNNGDPYDYGGNTLERTFPDGMDAEVMTLETLGRLDKQSVGIDREHVTSSLIRDPEPFRCINIEYSRYLADIRMTIDTDDDLAKLRWVVREAAARNPGFTLNDLLVVEGYGG